MMRYLALCVFILSLLTGTVAGGELCEMELHDGSTLAGEITAFQNGIYTLKSESLGTMEVRESQIRTIRMNKTKGTAEGKAETGQNLMDAHAGAGISDLQTQMMNNEEVMDIIRSLQHDPDFQKLLEDPDVVKAVNSGDIASLLANPQFMKLLQNPAVQEIKDTLQK
jgi:hypothetical protein